MIQRLWLKQCLNVNSQCHRCFSVMKHQYNHATYTRNLHTSVNKLIKISLRFMGAGNLKPNRLQERPWFLHITENNVKFVADTLDSREKIILLNYLLKLVKETDLYANKEEQPIQPKKETREFLDKVDFILREQTRKLETYDKVITLIGTPIGNPSIKELLRLSLHTGLPYFIFGYMDNFLMIIFGDILDSYLGPLGYASLTSAALGNMISDVMSVILSVYIEKIIHYFSNFTKGQLSETQIELFHVRRIIELSKPAYVALGTVIGMWPLYFI